MSTALAKLEMKTGLIGTIRLAGPEPSQGGNISVFECVFKFYRSCWLSADSLMISIIDRYHRGRSEYAGQDFALVYRNYAENVRKPFHTFASRAFREYSASL
jgi:hypothetical protein